MTRFDECLAFVLAKEGGFVDHRFDRGGATNKGITQAVYDAWRERNDLGPRSVRQIADDEVRAIYREDYWLPACCESFTPPLDLVIFDSAVQHGVKRAVKWLQNIVGAVPDGDCGPKTLYAVAGYVLRNRLPALIDEYMDARAAFYAGIVARDPSQKVFQRGWANRMNSLQDAIA